jgi:hypothetical protein
MSEFIRGIFGRRASGPQATPDTPLSPTDWQACFDALIARALDAQREAPVEQRAARPHILPLKFIAAEVDRLPTTERAGLLGFIAAEGPQIAGEYPYQIDYVLNLCQALRDNPPPVTPRVAADFLRSCGMETARQRRDHPAGLLQIIKLMQHEPEGSLVGYKPLQEAYLGLKRRFRLLASSKIVSDERSAILERLIGLESAAPVPAPAIAIPAADLTDGWDGPYLDEFAGALEDCFIELKSWKSAVDAINPKARTEAIDDWVWTYVTRLNNRPMPRHFAPVACFAALNPPPPPWLIDLYRPWLRQDLDFPMAISEEAGAHSFSVYILKAPDELGDPILSFPYFDRQAIARARPVKRAIEAGWPRYDWSGSTIAAPALLYAAEGEPGPLFQLLWQARSAVPTKKWLDEARSLLQGASTPAPLEAAANWLDEFFLAPASIPSEQDYVLEQRFEQFCSHARQAMAQFGDARAAAMAAFGPAKRREHFQNGREHPSHVSEENALILRGCIWLMSLNHDHDTIARLQRTALACLSAVPGSQYRSLKGLNACIWALGRIATQEAVTALGRIKLKIRDERLSKQLAKAMADAAAQAGMTIEDLEELAVPTFDLQENGERAVALAGGLMARLAIISTAKVEIWFERADGTAVKTLPAAVKADQPSAAALKALKASAAEITQVLQVSRLRLERSWLTGRSWAWPQFRQHILEHPLLAWLAIRLIWTVRSDDGVSHSCMFQANGQSTDAIGKSLPSPRDTDIVVLWHPLTPVEADAVTHWRGYLERHKIVQPIKQAHREIYPLTPAELASETYSNRFAGHIIRQAQANALGRLRGWSCRSRVWADVPNDESTHLKLPAQGLAAEYWTEGAGGEEPEVTDSQAYLFLKTDRVCFRRLIDDGDWRRDGGRGLRLTGEQIRLATVPPVVFSEVMRDIDLFVGVASIGHDPMWIDGGGDAQHPNQWRRGAALAYWHSFNTAELNESAKERRAFIASLLPSLAIASQLTLDDRYLAVRGSLRTYKIHLGSGNILMEPDGRYLCIVQSNAAVEPLQSGVTLPFEGDRLLSVILSKAFMLANDKAITDRSIVQQIRV